MFLLTDIRRLNHESLGIDIKKNMLILTISFQLPVTAFAVSVTDIGAESGIDDISSNPGLVWCVYPSHKLLCGEDIDLILFPTIG